MDSWSPGERSRGVLSSLVRLRNHSWTTTGAARCHETKKRAKYRETAAQHRAELLPFSVETYAGMALDAIKLLACHGTDGRRAAGSVASSRRH